jgi:hypothetical protein
MQKRWISICGTLELIGANTDAIVDRRLSIHREVSLEYNGTCTGEHRLEVC